MSTVSGSADIGGQVYPVSAAITLPAGFVTRSGQQLLLNGSPYRFTGFNVWRANISFQTPATGYLVNNGTTLADTLTAINANGGTQNVIRAWFLQQFVTPTTAGYNWAPFDKTLSVAAAAGFKVIAVLVDEWNYEGPPEKNTAWYSGGYSTVVNRGTLNGVTYNENVPYRQYVHDVATRYAGNPALLMWELTNEADISGGGTCPSNAGTIAANFASDVGGVIKAADPNHLVSFGIAGEVCGFNGADFNTVHSLPVIDLCSFHDYTGAANAGGTWGGGNGLNDVVSRAATLGKPAYVGETGIHLNTSPVSGSMTSRASYLGAKMSDAFNTYTGVTGYLPWHFDLRGVSGSGDDYVYGPSDPALAVMNSYALAGG